LKIKQEIYSDFDDVIMPAQEEGKLDPNDSLVMAQYQSNPSSVGN
jgi:hypothetical protein